MADSKSGGKFICQILNNHIQKFMKLFSFAQFVAEHCDIHAGTKILKVGTQASGECAIAAMLELMMFFGLLGYLSTRAERLEGIMSECNFGSLSEKAKVIEEVWFEDKEIDNCRSDVIKMAIKLVLDDAECMTTPEEKIDYAERMLNTLAVDFVFKIKNWPVFRAAVEDFLQEHFGYRLRYFDVEQFLLFSHMLDRPIFVFKKNFQGHMLLYRAFYPFQDLPEHNHGIYNKEPLMLVFEGFKREFCPDSSLDHFEPLVKVDDSNLPTLEVREEDTHSTLQPLWRTPIRLPSESVSMDVSDANVSDANVSDAKDSDANVSVSMDVSNLTSIEAYRKDPQQSFPFQTINSFGFNVFRFAFLWLIPSQEVSSFVKY